MKAIERFHVYSSISDGGKNFVPLNYILINDNFYLNLTNQLIQSHHIFVLFCIIVMKALFLQEKNSNIV